MPRFFFDVRDGGHYRRDRRGIDLADPSRAWEVAVPIVDELKKRKAHMPPPNSIAVVVRDEADTVVYRSDAVGCRRVPQPG